MTVRVHSLSRRAVAEAVGTALLHPAVTLARAATDTFAGIRPGDVPGFLAGQLVGAVASTALFRWLDPRAVAAAAADVLVAHSVQETSS